MGEILYVTNTASSATGLPGTETALLTGNVKPNHYANCRVSASVLITTNASTTARTITLRLKQGSTVIASRTVLTIQEARSINQHIEYIGPLNNGGAISVAMIGSAADATHTLLTGTNLYVEGI